MVKFPDAIVVWLGLTMGTDLGRNLSLFLEPVAPYLANLIYRDSERLFAVDVKIAIEGPVGDKGMAMVGRADDNCLNVLVVDAFSPIDIRLRPGKALVRSDQLGLVDVTKRHDVLGGNGVVEVAPTPANANQGNI
jgi:hypothetical protein